MADPRVAVFDPDHPTGSNPPARARLARVLRPRTITVIGGGAAAEVIRQCDRLGFDGDIWPVHPSHTSVEGRTAFRSVVELPEAPDAAFVAVNRHATIAAIADLARLGAGGAVCYASGFREANDGGEIERALLAAAGTMPIIGPNCYGMLNLLDRAALWPDQHGGRPLGATERGVAIVTQSSNIAISLTMQQRALPIAFMVTAGNQAQIGVSALADALLDDERVSALGLHVEAFDSVPGFEALARKARERGVPVVVMKAGRSERGRTATLSHTASIAGSDAGAEAFLRRLGFARVNGIPELLETLKLLHDHGPLDGPRVGVLCCSGGEAGVVADAVAETDLMLPSLARDHAAAVAATVHPLVTVANPLDYHTFSWGNEAALTETFAAFAREAFDITAVVLDFPRGDTCRTDDWKITQTAFNRAVDVAGVRGAVISTLPENLPEDAAGEMIECGIAPLAGVREALTAIECAAFVGSVWRSPAPRPLVTGQTVMAEPVLLDEAAAKARLSDAGVPVPDGRTAGNVEGAMAAAESLGGSVALKALGISHKTEHGAVRLDIRDPNEVPEAVEALLALARDSVASARLLVERYEAGMVAELIVGISRDPTFGPMLTIGTGGTLVELVADSVTLLLPVTGEEVLDALSTLRCMPILNGYRGSPAGDVHAAVDAILAIAQYGEDNANRLEELDVNPLGIRPRGQGAVALDALIRIRERGASPTGDTEP
ncbi:MAG: acetate--CoA ligase family protein [Gammaproteobacteria bacterium]|nr:acetate--CoA ligase family protein [Gammaproteobacteria bacterium]